MELNQRIVAARRDAGMTQGELAVASGKSRSAVTQWESGEVRPRPKTIAKIAEVTNKPLLWLESGIGEGGGGLKVIGKVAAGVWKERRVAFAPYDVPCSLRSDYPSAAQHLYEIEGPSINRIAREGEYLHAVSVREPAVSTEDGDLVIVRRLEHGMAEYTAKLLVRNGTGWILRPCSDDPRWQSDIRVSGDDGTEVEIIDIVIGKLQPFKRGAAEQLGGTLCAGSFWRQPD